MKNLLIVQTHPIHRRTARLAVIVLFAALLSAVPFHAAFAQTAPALGSAESFAVLAGTAVTCTDSTIAGDVGVYPGTAVTQTNCTINGTVHAGDGVAAAAYSDFLSAYNALAYKQCDYILSGNLAGQVLVPGVYCVDAASTTTGGTLTLNGPSNGIWIFKIGTSGTGALTGTNFSVVMSGGGQASNVYWWVAQAATMTDSSFQGTILAGTAITITRGIFNGGALAQAAVTMTGATYPSSVAKVTASNITVSGTNAGDVAPVVTGGGFINVVNNGAHVAATQTGTGTINIVNNGQVMAATNTGSGVMTINSTATGAVAVTRTGNGNTTVNATGSSVIALTFNGDGDVTYPN